MVVNYDSANSAEDHVHRRLATHVAHGWIDRFEREKVNRVSRFYQIEFHKRVCSKV